MSTSSSSSSPIPAAAFAPAAQPPAEARPSTNPMDTVRRMLDNGDIDGAMAALDRSGSKAPPVMNARGVCLMRLGKHGPAVAVFRDLVFPAGSFTMDHETPTVYQANYALALLLNHNPVIAASILSEIEDRDHPAVAKGRSVVKQWKREMSVLARVLLLVGVCPVTSVTLDAPPGELV